MACIVPAAIEQEIRSLLDNASLNYGTLEKFNTLCEALRNFSMLHLDFTEQDAKEWAEHMEPPARWTLEQTTTAMTQRGYDHRPCEFYAVMNAMASDYGKTLAKYGVDRPEVWAEMAHDFIMDADAVPGKVGRYYRDIVDH